MQPVPPPKNVAVVHDWLVDMAGAEKVLEQILALYPDATLYTLIDRMPAPDRARFKSRATVTSFLNRLPRVERYFTRCLPLMPLAMQQFDLSGHDLIISSSHCVAKGVITPPDALHLCYCHSPMRYAWDMQEVTLRTENLHKGPKTWVARPLMHRLRLWDAASTNGVDHIAANSSFVQGRIRKAWRRESTVIHPPVQLAAHQSPTEDSRRPRHHVTAGRLMGYKNVALMLQAFKQLPDHSLHVVGDGPLLSALRSQAPPNVRFLGRLAEPDLRREMRSASSFVFAAIEDFGITPAEALAEGTPVVALARGGALDYLRHGHNAWLFGEGTADALSAAVADSSVRWPADVAQRCMDSVAGLGPARFKAEFAQWVHRCWSAWLAERAVARQS
jgi:glycosyltransferase involved in cell wall biosynthesis